MKSAIVKFGILAGLMDITGASIQYLLSGGKNPVRILLYISSALIGPDAYAGGAPVAILGFLLHMFNAMAFTVFFFMIYPVVRNVTTNQFALSIGYGACVWFVMNVIVVPLSRIPARALTLQGSLIAMAILIVCIATPITWGARRYFEGKQ